MNITLNRAHIGGTITVPSSKSQTIRALLIATFSKSTSIIKNPLISSDSMSCIDACRTLGATIEIEEDYIRVKPPTKFPDVVEIDCGNSGTTLYLLCAMVASLSTRATFFGDNQLNNRPVQPLLQALMELGVEVSYPSNNTKEWYPPFTLQGPITGGEVNVSGHTSQYLSALLLGSVMAQSSVEIKVDLLNEKPYVEMTLEWLKKQQLSLQHDEALSYFYIKGKEEYSSIDVTIGGDYSSASFFFSAAAVAKGTIEVKGLNRNDTQGDKEVLTILEKMGCTIHYSDDRVIVSLEEDDELVGGTFNLNAIPDALPILAVVASVARGTTVLSHVPQARIKETDRIDCMKKNLQILGVQVEDTIDSIIIHGQKSLNGGLVNGYGDHRIIMAMAIASLVAHSPITIQGIEAVEVTFPTFFTLLETIKQENF